MMYIADAIIRRAAFIMLLLAAMVRSAAAAAPAAPTSQPSRFILHLNGIGGRLPCDEGFVAGLRAGGVDGQIVFYDWTEGNPGVPALRAYEQNKQEARRIAELLAKQLKERPRTAVYITAHSAGSGLIAWALEDLPEGAAVESVFMLAPALSPGYDLSRALRHIHGKLYVFSSRYDAIVLDTGTKLFGTVDGVKSEAAGLDGFIRPAGADEGEYRKLVAMPYDSRWLLRYGNAGDHIGALGTRFARLYVAKLLLGIRPELEAKPPTTQAAGGFPVGLPMRWPTGNGAGRQPSGQ